MEECEALCTRLAIMVNGSFQCLGTTQHLKYNLQEEGVFVGWSLPVTGVFPTKVFVNFAKQQSGEDDDITTRLRNAGSNKKNISPLRRKKLQEEEWTPPAPIIYNTTNYPFIHWKHSRTFQPI
ncbi:hypothetical protein NHX12_004162 [Muraenolepis orangiensis]|uniref:Uncharacterized protein n=1 Tax=Muraenolepis orangiensis TaxID=630683 RepID=A0A9Q0DYI0_9TELE|nr:hypothetical protein NHX12_004162 [Muraenolepis orangiensis]